METGPTRKGACKSDPVIGKVQLKKGRNVGSTCVEAWSRGQGAGNIAYIVFQFFVQGLGPWEEIVKGTLGRSEAPT